MKLFDDHHRPTNMVKSIQLLDHFPSFSSTEDCFAIHTQPATRLHVNFCRNWKRQYLSKACPHRRHNAVTVSMRCKHVVSFGACEESKQTSGSGRSTISHPACSALRLGDMYLHEAPKTLTRHASTAPPPRQRVTPSESTNYTRYIYIYHGEL